MLYTVSLYTLPICFITTIAIYKRHCFIVYINKKIKKEVGIAVKVRKQGQLSNATKSKETGIAIAS